MPTDLTLFFFLVYSNELILPFFLKTVKPRFFISYVLVKISNILCFPDSNWQITIKLTGCDKYAIARIVRKIDY